jgi:hypothetical protein
VSLFGSPHEGVSDIWLRYRPKAELTDALRYREPFIPRFYPEWHALPELRPIVFTLMAAFESVQLGGILITRIPPGGQVKPHNDRGSWHSEFFNSKIYVPLRANTLCTNWCQEEDGQYRGDTMAAGECWTFNNQVDHGVVNNGPEERITLIVCLRTER